MAGGLLQIVSAGKEDIFLTINPQITFFKTVYLRYSNFAIETLEETFDGNPNFGEEVTCNISKNGDLIYNLYVKIDIPQVLIPKPTSYTEPTLDTTTLTNFNTFSKPLFSLWRKLYVNITSSSSNISTIQSIIDAFVISDEYQSYTPYRNQFQSYYLDLLYEYNTRFKTQYINSIYNPTETTQFKSIFLAFLENLKLDSINFKQELIQSINTTQSNNAKKYSNYYKFGWIQKLGLRLIDKISFKLGGQVIDSITSDMLNIWSQLSIDSNHRPVYDQMIGDVPSLTNYDTTLHPAYTLYIPIPFWFARYHGAALPCVALRYHDIQVSVQFRDITDCCFFESYEESLLDDINLAEIVKLSNASLLIDYVYLDIDEKNKYGNSNLEYLIEQHQYLLFNDINIKNFNTSITFVNPVKEIFWVAQLNSNIKKHKVWDKYNDVNVGRIIGFSSDISRNLLKLSTQQYDIHINDYINIANSRYYNGTYKVLDIDYNNDNMITGVYVKGDYFDTDTGYLHVDRTNNTFIDTLQLISNGVDFTPRTHPSFFNHLMSYKRHTNTPPDAGIFLYSYALQPELFQPTGSCNMSHLSSNDIYFKLTDPTIHRIKKTNDTMLVKIFARSMNILSVSKGISYLEFSA